MIQTFMGVPKPAPFLFVLLMVDECMENLSGFVTIHPHALSMPQLCPGHTSTRLGPYSSLTRIMAHGRV
ncbi:MAG TPA: hypothetical protein VGD33_08545 [Chitinophagaceae bacterium]